MRKFIRTLHQILLYSDYDVKKLIDLTFYFVLVVNYYVDFHLRKI